MVDAGDRAASEGSEGEDAPLHPADAATVERLRGFCVMLPEATEVETFGNPTFRVATKPFAVFERYAGAPVISVKTALDDQVVLVARDGFEIAPYTGHHGWTNIRLDFEQDWDEIDDLVVGSYRLQAPERLVTVLDELLAAAGHEVPAAVEEEGEVALPPPHATRRVVRIIEFRTDRYDEVQAAEAQWLDATAGMRPPSRVLRCRDTADERAWTYIEEYASVDDVKHHDELPETALLAQRMGELCDEPPTVRDVEVDEADRL